MKRPLSRRNLLALPLAVAGSALLGCAGNSPGGASSTGGPAATAAAGATGSSIVPVPASKVTLNLGYLTNVTHATVIAGLATGIYARNLGPNLTLKTATFDSGTPEVTAIFSQALDAAYMGPNPAINAFVQSKGQAVRIISGATSGGAYLVVRPDITSAKDLKGKKVASPSLGNTQDVALRNWLSLQGYKTDPQGGGDVSVLPEDNATTVNAFRSGQIAGAWVPEPWATILAQEAGGKVLVDERSLWPNGQYATTLLVVRADFLQKYPDVVNALLAAQTEANSFVNAQTEQAQMAVGAGISKVTGQNVNAQELAASWKNLTFTNDPIASSLQKSADAASSLGFLKLNGVDLAKIYDLDPLNAVLAKEGQSTVSGP